MVELRIRLFGELDIRAAERIAPLESARARSLLAYLLLHDGVPQSRPRLAFLPWPDSTESQARTNLRHLLHSLRAAGPPLDPFRDVTPQTLRWHGDGRCWTDVAAFEAARRSGHGHLRVHHPAGRWSRRLPRCSSSSGPCTATRTPWTPSPVSSPAPCRRPSSSRPITSGG